MGKPPSLALRGREGGRRSSCRSPGRSVSRCLSAVAPEADDTMFARSALSIRAAHLILLFGLRPSVRKIIDFCREDLRAASSLLSTGDFHS